jgi:hypothetical protein
MISVGNKILIPKKTDIVWDYEGIMTVGNFDIYYGYIKDFFGGMNPANPHVDGFTYETTLIYYFLDSGNHYLVVGGASGETLYNSCNYISIDETVFSGFVDGILEVSGNPFPTPGNTCNIKLA